MIVGVSRRRKLLTISTLSFGVLLGATGAVFAQAGPEYANQATRTIVERMVTAHGGFDRWIAAPSFRYTAGMYLASLPVSDERSYYDNWRYYTVTLEPRTSRGVVELPFESRRGPVMGFDGKTLWSHEYEFDPAYRDSPLMLLFMHYGWISLPWMTQFPEASLEFVGREPLEPMGGEFDVVEMRFNSTDHNHGGYFRLYVDPDDHRLRAFTSTISFPHLPGGAIPQDMEGGADTGGLYRLFDAYTEVDGLVIPRSYATVRIADGEQTLMGVHLVIDPSFSRELDPSYLVAPAGARVLRSSSP